MRSEYMYAFCVTSVIPNENTLETRLQRCTVLFRTAVESASNLKRETPSYAGFGHVWSLAGSVGVFVVAIRLESARPLRRLHMDL